MAVRIDSGVARQLSERGCDTYLELTDEEEDDDDDSDDEVGRAVWNSLVMKKIYGKK